MNERLLSCLQLFQEQQAVLAIEIRQQPLDLAGDGRCDSPGYCAKYLTYSMLDVQVGKIVCSEQVVVKEVSSYYL